MEIIKSEQLSAFLENRYKNSIFKIVPLYEENSKTLSEYVNSVVLETNGLIKMLPNQYLLISVVAILKQLEVEVEKEDNKKVIKREAFKALELVGKVIKGLENGGV